MTGGVALVTGSSRGIGLAAAVELARAGFAVAVNGPAEDDELGRAVALVREQGAAAVAVSFDVADLAAHEPALDRIEAALGPLTTLVNNAGVGVLSRGDPLDVSEASWDRCFAVNAKSAFFLTQAFARRLIARGKTEGFRSVVNVTSSNAVAVALSRAEYCASKAAAAMASKAWAVRLGAEGVAVYDVQPGVIATAMTAPALEDYARRIDEGLTLIPRVGQPEDVGRVIAALAEGRLPYVTGQAISVDGGMILPRF